MWKLSVVCFGLLAVISCGSDPVPKPAGYFRIDLAEQAYLEVPTPCAIRFETPTYSKVALKDQQSTGCFMDVIYPAHKAKLHLTYRPVEDNLRRLITDAQGFKTAHQSRANRIDSERVIRDSAGVFGTMYAVDGDVASPMVFYLTDSVQHFLYGALYFSAPPNGDSLAPVTDRLREDIKHLGASLQWP